MSECISPELFDEMCKAHCFKNENVRIEPREEGDDFVEVIIRVPDEIMESAWDELEKPLKESPDYDEMLRNLGNSMIHVRQHVFQEEELKLLCGAFKAIVEYLPAGPFEVINWVDQWDNQLSNRQFVRQFIADHIAKHDDFMWELSEDELKRLPERVADYLVKRKAQEAEAAELARKAA